MSPAAFLIGLNSIGVYSGPIPHAYAQEATAQYEGVAVGSCRCGLAAEAWLKRLARSSCSASSASTSTREIHSEEPLQVERVTSTCSHRDNNHKPPSARTALNPTSGHEASMALVGPLQHPPDTSTERHGPWRLKTAEQGTPPTYPPLLGLLARHLTHSRIQHAARPSPQPHLFHFEYLFIFFLNIY